MKKLILFLLIGIFLVSLISAAEFTPIFCNDYEFTGCYAEESIVNEQISDEESWTCPGYAHKCYVESVEDNEEWFVGSGNCYLDTSNFCEGWVCDQEYSRRKNMDPGDHLYLESECLNPEKYAEVKITKPILKFSGTACGAGGAPVPGADGCTFNPEGGIVYESNNNIENKKEGPSYTVLLTLPSPTCVMSWVSGNRHICGYKEESCSSNSDCEGHTYGNKECAGRFLETYGCRNYGSELGKLTSIEGGLLNLDGDTAGIKEDLSQPTSGNADFGQRCEIISSEPVQCCGDTDCGSGMFCDITTFTCKEEVQCEKDVDCGVSIQCDWTINTLKKPICKNGKCSYDEKNVECCNDKNCEEGGFCDEEYRCRESSFKTQDISQTGITGAATAGAKGKSSSTGTIILIVFLVLIGGSIAYYFYTNKKKTTPKKGVKKELETKGKHCTKCGSLLKSRGKFCSKCGREVKLKKR